MAEIGIDISAHRSKHLNEFLNQPIETVINRSINQTLSRTILTSGATMLVVLALFYVAFYFARDWPVHWLGWLALGAFFANLTAIAYYELSESYSGQARAKVYPDSRFCCRHARALPPAFR